MPYTKAISPYSSQLDGGKVLMDRSYRRVDDPDTEISADDRIRAYKYGKQLVN